jgi:hypothetical protein
MCPHVGLCYVASALINIFHMLSEERDTVASAIFPPALVPLQTYWKAPH